MDHPILVAGSQRQFESLIRDACTELDVKVVFENNEYEQYMNSAGLDNVDRERIALLDLEEQAQLSDADHRKTIQEEKAKLTYAP
jgi:hypothetical protein